jgi:polar amino acid transport system substrate-binding protein
MMGISSESHTSGARQAWGRPGRRLLLTAGVSTLLLLTAACGGNGDGSTSAGGASETAGQGSTSGANELRALMPQRILDAGKLSVATTPTYPPYEYLDSDGTTIIGQNADVMEEMAKLFGLKVEWSNVAQFGTLIPGIASGRYDTAVIFEDIPEREKVVDLVDFYRDALAFLGAKDAPMSDQTACGKKVAVGTGNGPALLAPDLNKKLCTDQGKPAMEILSFANTDGQFTALTSKRVDFVLISNTVAKLFAEKNPEFDVRSNAVAHTTRAIPVKKGEEQLQKAFVAGLQELVDNGTMKTIMEKWKTTDGFIDKVTVNVPGTVS